jgi:hypothetical protein
MANEFNYESIFGSDFSLIREGLEQMPDNVEGMLLGVMDSMVYNVDNFARNLEQTVTQLTANGVTSETILSTLKADQDGAGRIFGQLTNDTKANLAMGMSHAGRLGQYEDYTDKDLFTWVTVAGHKVCLDCDGRGGSVMTYKEWESEGVPGSGWSVCKGWCYCVLDPSGKASERVKGAKVKEPKAASVPVKKKNILDKVFKSKNTIVNDRFKEAFKNSSSRFKSFISKFPSLRLIAHHNMTSHFHNAAWGRNIWAKWMGKKLDMNYLRMRGGINIQHLGSRRVAATIRHEYGHWLHHNLHYQGYYMSDMKDVLKVYKPARKTAGSIEGAVQAIGYKKGSAEYKSIVDYMRFFEAAGKDARKSLMLGKGRYSNEMVAIRNFYDELYGVQSSASRKYISAKHSKLLGDDFIEALIQDGLDGTGNSLGIMDTIGALTKNQVGFGHSTNYYNKGGMPMQLHEVFANLTALHSHENPIWWEFIQKNLPYLAEYYENTIDEVVANGFFGASI